MAEEKPVETAAVGIEKTVVSFWESVSKAFQKAGSDLLAGLQPDWKMLPTAIGVLVVAYLVGKVAQFAVLRFCKHREVDETFAKFMARSSNMAVLAVGLITALSAMNMPVHTLVAGIGLTGLVLGIALKDIVSNAVSGVMLLTFRPFRHRDYIKVGDHEGEVVDVDMRYTQLDCGDRFIYIPNALMFANAVTVKPKPRAEKRKQTRAQEETKPLTQETTRIDPPSVAPAEPPRTRARALAALRYDDDN